MWRRYVCVPQIGPCGPPPRPGFSREPAWLAPVAQERKDRRRAATHSPRRRLTLKKCSSRGTPTRVAVELGEGVSRTKRRPTKSPSPYVTPLGEPCALAPAEPAHANP